MFSSKNYQRDYTTHSLDYVLSYPRHYAWHAQVIIQGSHLWSRRTVHGSYCLSGGDHLWQPHLVWGLILGDHQCGNITPFFHSTKLISVQKTFFVFTSFTFVFHKSAFTRAFCIFNHYYKERLLGTSGS